MTVSRLVINGRDFHLHSAHSRAQHAASGKPFTEHCHGREITTMPERKDPWRKRELAVMAFILVIGIFAIAYAAEAQIVAGNV